MSQSQDEVTIQSSTNHSEERYPIRLVNHKNQYAKILVDVDGNVLCDRNGTSLNVYKKEMDEAFLMKDIRLFRNSTTKNICYRYYTTSEDQKTRFWNERSYGSPSKGTLYHVYVDEDTNVNTEEYRSIFLS